MDDALAALLAALELKEERRTGWELREVTDPESVAAHSWGVSLLVLVYGGDAGVDVDRALRMAVVHDLAEAETGDVPTRVDPADQPVTADEKAAMEAQAIQGLLGPFDGDLLARWEEYEARETPEAQFVKDMDLVEMCLQALYYECEGRYPRDGANEAFEAFDALDEFFATAEPRLRTDVGRSLFETIRSRYERARDDS
ncbi:HD domain-containing protein [Halobacteriaceae archaeon GCM10025711]